MVRHSTLIGTDLHDPLGSSRVGKLSFEDNKTTAFLADDVVSASNTWIQISTDSVTPSFKFGSLNRNPYYQFLGNGPIKCGESGSTQAFDLYIGSGDVKAGAPQN